MKNVKHWAAAAAMVFLACTAQATLVNLGDGTVQDTATNLIWLQNWNVNGKQDWVTQNTWAETLTFAGSSEWALPSIGDFANLFAEVGNLSLESQFTNVQPQLYWSGTGAAGSDAFAFQPNFGVQTAENIGAQFFAVAVRRGEALASVAEPQTLSLILLALSATVVRRSKKSI
jgi:hypothetical protein